MCASRCTGTAARTLGLIKLPHHVAMSREKGHCDHFPIELDVSPAGSTGIIEKKHF